MKCENCPEEATVQVVWAGSIISGSALLCSVCSMECHQLLVPYILVDDAFTIQEVVLGDWNGRKEEAGSEEEPEEGLSEEGDGLGGQEDE